MMNKLLVDLLKRTDNYALLAQYRSGKLDEYQVLQELINQIDDADVKAKAQKLLDLAKNKLKQTLKGKEVITNNLEMLEAYKHGISTETYLFNKHLSLEKKLALPDAWQVIYALNYKEKKHGKTKRRKK